ncbi:hypothetical protein SAMN00790413_01883 [Deinococcus hopiensis KR-140]|uniref:Uncharacterized protein n=1 Tax=Deinococcus hopiensis KR-140 TaxID=695939 RepID=A0A1W1VIT6_9DEIO|nr:hypothetical protein SAMN00790413_01883 [Deinococcus hopiensis KR-140]
MPHLEITRQNGMVHTYHGSQSVLEGYLATFANFMDRIGPTVLCIDFGGGKKDPYRISMDLIAKMQIIADE